MKKGRVLLTLLGGAISLLIAAILGGQWWLGSQIDRDALVARMESEWNCRVQIERTDLSLWSSPARVSLHGVKFAARDAEVGKPLATRAPLDESTVRLSLSEAVLEVALADLIQKRLSVQRLGFHDLAVREEITKDGKSTLGEYFKKPARSEPPPAPIETAAVTPPADSITPPTPTVPATPTPAPPPPEPPAPVAKANSTPGFKAELPGISLAVKEAGLKRASLNLLNRKTKTRTIISDLDFALSEIDLDPANLGAHNQCKLSVEGKLALQGGFKIGKEIQHGELVNLNLAGQGTVRPLDPANAEWRPRVEWDMIIKKDSVIAGHMTLGQADADGLKKLKDYGIDLSEVAIGGPLQQDARIKITFNDDRIDFLEDAHFVLTDYELVVGKGSWVNSEADDHELLLRLLCGEKLKAQVRNGIIGTGIVNEKLADEMIQAFSDEKGRLYFDVKSTGRLSKPDPKIDTGKLLDRLLKGGGINSVIEGLINTGK